MTKSRRLSKNSVPKYTLKRLSINLGTATHHTWSRTASPRVVDLVLDVSINEAENWYTNYQLYHRVKSIVKSYMNELEVPTRYQGLFMALAEKIVANWYVDYKGQSLVSMMQEYTRKLSNYTAGAMRPTITYVRANGSPRTIDLTVVLTETARRVLTALGMSSSAVGSALAGAGGTALTP